jgi:DNA-directed RNA polymerase specialized sigma24 family protein
MGHRRAEPASRAFRKDPLPPVRSQTSGVIPTSLDVPVPPSAQETARCPHGGFIVNGLPLCGHCCTINGPEIYARVLFQVCKWEAQDAFCTSIGWGKHVNYSDKEDMAGSAFLKLIQNTGYISKARNPIGRARMIARNTIADLLKAQRNRNELLFSDFSEDQNFAEDHFSKPEGCFIGRGIGRDSDYNIPGGEKIFNPVWRSRLVIALHGAMERLPRPPEDKVPMEVSLMIKLWTGTLEGIDKSWSYEEIATHCDSQPHKIKYEIQKGLKSAREYILTEAAKPIREQTVQKEQLHLFGNKRDKK